MSDEADTETLYCYVCRKPFDDVHSGWEFYNKYVHKDDGLFRDRDHEPIGINLHSKLWAVTKDKLP